MSKVEVERAINQYMIDITYGGRPLGISLIDKLTTYLTSKTTMIYDYLGHVSIN